MTPLLLSLLVLLLKSLAVLALAGPTLLALRQASAASRHLVCLLTLVALLALPLFSQSPFSLPVSMPTVLPHAPANLTPRPLLPQGEGAELGQEAGADRPDTVGAGSPRPSSPRPAFPNPSRFGRGGEERTGVGSWPAAFLALWLLGILAASVRPLLGLWGIGQLARRSRPEASPAVLTLAADCAAALGLSLAPAVRRGDVPVPMTWGLRRPVVLLPEAASAWPDGRLEAVLLHELAHIRRRDWAAHRLADLACALYWFHPLVWLTARRLRAEGEIACDDLVLSSGVSAPDYARHLLDIARALSPASPAVPAGTIAMARTAQVEGRITMILKPAQNRRALTRRALLLALLPATAAVGIIAALRPAVQAAPAPTPTAPLAQTPPVQRFDFRYSSATFSSTVQANHGGGRIISTAPDFAINGTQLLAGVSSLKGYGNVWWSANGTSLPHPVFAVQKAQFLAVSSASQQNSVLFAFRLPPSAKDVTTRWEMPQSLAYSSGGTWITKLGGRNGLAEAKISGGQGGVRTVKALYPASLKAATLRVGLAFGAWTAAATQDTHNARFGATKTGAAGTFIFSPLTQNARGQSTVTVSTEQRDLDIRVVAIDAQGHKFLPAGIGDQSIDKLAQITANFSRRPTDPKISQIRVETRPFGWIELKNIALHPSQH